MAKYVNITSATTTTLLQKSDTQHSGNITSIIISNNDNAAATVSLFLDLVSGTGDFYFFKSVVIPIGVSLVFDDKPSFNIDNYSLKLTNAGSDDLSIIIK